ncbi:bifunctional hydroxymethylpyrimidine kinase/phosphomethylpyrimidine kinase [Magnetofaba australis]|uniref:hydroxymethylpyrimidine kinase n=1 Tax=Magnetofaba australis IT-1 TaxID=1434232 RepID=A0A1Y2K111_9PROT|nr:bifunctional hydroxymethylpyrimidine kinase/phosphomethylpyrimidine kinase [Magnetofaba australis]OSM00443.1 putative phosphomethylpyrimidine kinase [Magnetofaba australis IT-1]
MLSVAGSDPTAGAGLQADLKSIHALGGYAATAVTAVTVQNTHGVTQVAPLAGELVAAQMRAVLADLPVQAIKLGMLGDGAVTNAVADVLNDYADIPLVADTVMRGGGGVNGDALLADAAVSLFKQRIAPRAALITPNIPETERLIGQSPRNEAQMAGAARALCEQLGCGAALITGGHLPGEMVMDLLYHAGQVRVFHAPRLPDAHGFHGTGCALASACAVGLARGEAMEEAVSHAIGFVREAIVHAYNLGGGQWLLNHKAG